MSAIIAYCGLGCSSCPAFIATQNNDDDAREKAAEYFLTEFGLNYTVEEISCDGCLTSGGRHLEYCRTCDIRQCCHDKKADHCVVCDEQPCEKLKKRHAFSVAAKNGFESFVKEIDYFKTKRPGILSSR